MYLSTEQVKKAYDALAGTHPFHLVTFLPCKAHRLPVGKSKHFAMAEYETEHLRSYFSPGHSSSYFLRVSRVNGAKAWRGVDYPEKGAQKSRTSTFKGAFIHKADTDQWGWHTDYVAFLESKLHRKKLIPACHMAVWFLRDRDWSKGAGLDTIMDTFFDIFNISDDEKGRLFDVTISDEDVADTVWTEEPLSLREFQSITGRMPDAEPDEGGALALLELSGLGPARLLTMEPADRVSLITGDNGFGKTFLLECGWWALSGFWAGLPAYPREDADRRDPKIAFRVFTESGPGEKKQVRYDWDTDTWPRPKDRPTIPGLVVYARVDGSFSVWDPARARVQSGGGHSRTPGMLSFSPDTIWHGSNVDFVPKGRVLCNGVIRDWVTWQHSSERVFKSFCEVLKRLSPTDLGPFEPGLPTRLPGDAREIPTIKQPYGTVPILHASAGVKRIIAIAYLLVWAWEEHKTQSGLLRRACQRRMVVLIDELEAHLHPRWQRVILPALVDVCDDLDPELQTQFLVATHSPLVTASMESFYDEDRDKLFHLAIAEHGDLTSPTDVTLSEKAFVRYGRADRWLTSDVFELGEACSLEAEKAIRDALGLQEKMAPSKREIQEVSTRLAKHLSAEDSLWPRWVHFAEEHGVKL